MVLTVKNNYSEVKYNYSGITFYILLLFKLLSNQVILLLLLLRISECEEYVTPREFVASRSHGIISMELY